MENHSVPNSYRTQTLIRLVNEYQSTLLRICYIALRDEEMARDAVQESFLKAYRALDTFRGDSNEKTWLTQIALNTCRSMRRSAWIKHIDRRITPEELPHIPCPSREEEQELMCEILRLPLTHREVIMLYYWQDMTMTEIAQTLNISVSTVSTRLKSARQKLRRQLERRSAHGQSAQ